MRTTKEGVVSNWSKGELTRIESLVDKQAAKKIIVLNGINEFKNITDFDFMFSNDDALLIDSTVVKSNKLFDLFKVVQDYGTYGMIYMDEWVNVATSKGTTDIPDSTEKTLAQRMWNPRVNHPTLFLNINANRFLELVGKRSDAIMCIEPADTIPYVILNVIIHRGDIHTRAIQITAHNTERIKELINNDDKYILFNSIQDDIIGSRQRDYDRKELAYAIIDKHATVRCVDSTGYMSPTLELVKAKFIQSINGSLNHNYIVLSSRKGSGKSRMMRALRGKYMMVDSDLYGRYLYEIDVNGVDPTDVNWLYHFMLNSGDSNPSFIEIAAGMFLEKKGLSISQLSKQINMKLYGEFDSSLITACNKILTRQDYTTMLTRVYNYGATLSVNKWMLPVIEFVHASTEGYAIMTNGLYEMENYFDTDVVVLDRQRPLTTPLIDYFLSRYYQYVETSLGIPIPLTVVRDQLEQHYSSYVV